MPGIWNGRHRHLLCWRVGMQALVPGQQTLAELARWPPASRTAWRFRRLVQASSWRLPLRVTWGAEEALQTLPPPKDGTLPRVGDGREQPKRGTHNPLAQQGRKRAQHPWCVGMRFVLVLANGDGYRLPGALRRIRPTSPPESPTEKALCRARVESVVPPTWAKRMLVEGAAASGSQAPRPMVLKRDADEPARRWGVGCAMARTGQTVAGKALTDLGTHGPRISSQRIRVPRLPGTTGWKTFWG